MLKKKLSEPMIENLVLKNITNENVEIARQLNKLIFPVRYSDQFYRDLVNSEELTKIIYIKEKPIGIVGCKVKKTEDDLTSAYIILLGCLASFRRRGVGSVLLKEVLNYYKNNSEIDCIDLHVQTNNGPALDFYEKFGFEFIKKELNYYKRMNPPSAFLLRKQIKGC